MIKTLRLDSFGHFNNIKFDFAPITFFYGPNESGKTTVFDALFQSLTNPKKTLTCGKTIVNRYGADIKASLEYDGDAFDIEAEEFLNLYAIRSGIIADLKIDKNSQSMNHIKASLFTGGIDPQSVAKNLSVIATTTKKNTPGGELKELTPQLEALEKELGEAEAQRQKCLKEENHITNAGSRITQIEEEILRLTKIKEELEKSLNQQDMLRQKKNIENTLICFSEKRRNDEELEKYSRYIPAALDELKKQEEKIQQLTAEAGTAAAMEDENLRSLKDSAEKRSRSEAEKSAADSRRVQAESLRRTLVPKDKFITRKTRRSWRMPFLFIAGILLIAAVSVFLLASENIIIPISLMGFSVVFAALAPTRITWEDTSALDAAIQSVREQWKKETGEDIGSLLYEDILSALDRAAERARSSAQDAAREAAQINDLENKKIVLAQNKKQADDALAAAKQQMRGLLDNAGVNDTNGYAAMLEKKKNIRMRCIELEEKIKRALTDNKTAAVGEMEAILKLKSDEITEKLIETELPDNEVIIKKNLLRDTNIKLEALQREEKDNIASHSSIQTAVKVKFQGLPEKIAALEKDIHEKKNRQTELKKELRAVEIAKELFVSMSDDSSLMLEQLSGEIGKTFSLFTSAGRAVSMENLSTDNANISDAGGTDRNHDLLSAGTRDAFILAARLVLARKSVDEGKSAIIVLDEPFLTFDRQRTANALAVLEEFHKTTLWQIVIFTKDEELLNQADVIFGGKLRVHKLGAIK
jgi:DNA sulfur modification protein DndD